MTDEEGVMTSNGSLVAVLVSPDEFEAWRETLAIKADAAFMDEVRKGRAAPKKGMAKLYSIETLSGMKETEGSLRVPDDVVALIRSLHLGFKAQNKGGASMDTWRWRGRQGAEGQAFGT